MRSILLHIKDDVSRKTFKCNVLEDADGWSCILYQEYFQFQFIKEKTLPLCLEKLAWHLEQMHDIQICGEENHDDIYIAILQGYIRILRSDRLLNRRLQG